MSEPPPDHGNVVDPDVLAARRARRAEVSEDATLELRLFDAERRLREMVTERDALRAALTSHERDLRAMRQREWAEQQQRLEAQGETAATRATAAEQVARLRERLAQAEAKLRLVETERDRVRVALEREHEAAAADRTRRVTLEREHQLLRAELGRARHELTTARGVQARWATERSAFAKQVIAVEQAVGSVRDRLGGAVRVLRDQLETERGARQTAEASVVALERELAQRAAVEVQLRGALDGLKGELAAVRAGDDARVAALTARVERVMVVAAELRDSAVRERDVEAQALVTSLAAMQARMAELTEGLAAAAAVRQELDAERTARWVAEAELDAERAARAAAEARLDEVEGELASLRAPAAAVVNPETLASLRATLDRLRTATPADAAPTLGQDLAAAAARLRSVADPAPASDPGAPASGPELDASEPSAPPVRSALPEREPITTAGPWLRDALVALAADEPELAELLFVALLPAQAGAIKRTLAYELAIDGSAAHRVVLEDDRALVEPAGAPVKATVRGPLGALVPLAAGGAERRLPGATIEGRRALRRLLKARRAPLGLAELAAAGVAPSPGLLLTAVARAVPTAWMAGCPLSVDIAVGGADRWRVVASGEDPLNILPASGQHPSPATLHVAAGRLTAVLAATGGSDDAWVEGDLVAVRTLLGWLDRAQRAR